MLILLMLPFLFSDFVQKWYISDGMIGEVGRLVIIDADRDGSYEFYMPGYGSSQRIHVYELHLPDIWEADSFSYLYDPLVWDAGDLDLDGLYDLVLDASATQSYPTMVISIAESPDSFSYPTQEVWRDTVDIGTVQPICVYDIDKDSIPEILQTGGEAGTNYYIDFSIYESIGDNTYEVKYSFESPETPTSTIAFGDFDSDSLNEFVMGTIDGQYSIFESPENDTYIPLSVNIQLPTVNIKDCFSVPDADEDGKMEFVVKGFWVYGTIDAFIFEAIGDNTYEIIKTFNFPGGDYYGGYSEAGDVDGDSIPEIVLEARQNVFIIKAEGNDSFYVWDTLPGHNSGSSIAVYDIDDNGLAEIIISGNNETRIYEYDPGAIEETDLRLTPDALRLEVYPNPFREKTTIRYIIQNVGQGFSLANSKPEGLPYICIYDVSGRLVRQFDYPTIRQSDHIIWYGDDDKGRTASQGIYFLRIENLETKESIVRKVLKIE